MKLLMSSLLFTLLTTGCGVQLNLGAPSKASFGGKVPGLQGLIAHQGLSTMDAFAAPLCTDAQARLIKLTELGKPGETVESSPVRSDTSFRFTRTSLTESEKIDYIIEVSGCEEVLSRPVTAFDLSQDVTAASTVIGLLTKVDTTQSLKDTNKKQVAELMKSLSGASVDAVYSNLQSNTALASTFQQIFQESPTVLATATPTILNLNVNQVVFEGLSNQYSVNASHFNPNYNIAYVWKLDGVVKSNTSTWTYLPKANDQGSKTLSLYIGKDDGAGNIDTSVGYIHQSYLITVVKDLLPSPPSVSVASSVVASRSLNLMLNTGAALSNCESFSSIAVTENSSAVPGDSSFVHSCTTSGTQVLPYVLASAGDGPKALRIWAKDASGAAAPV